MSTQQVLNQCPQAEQEAGRLHARLHADPDISPLVTQLLLSSMCSPSQPQPSVLSR